MLKDTNNRKKIIHVVGANTDGGGVFTYIKNINHSFDNFLIYNYHDYHLFFKRIKPGDTIFFNVVKPSIPFLFLVFIKGAFRFNKVYCGHGINFKNNVGIRRFFVYFFEFILTYFTDYNIVLNEKDLEWFRKINKNSICIPTSLKPSVFFKNFRKRKFKTSSIKWIAVGAVEPRKDPYLFIDIAKKIRTIYPNDTFTWVGDGPLFKDINLKELSKQNIFFTGKLENADVKSLLLDMDIFICTSKYEVLPISILESVEASNIIITRNYPYCDDIINRFSSSAVFKNIDDIIKIRSDYELLKKLNSNALKERGLIKSSYDNYIFEIKNILNK